MVPFAAAEWVQDTVGILSPVISALVLALVMYMIRKYLPENVRGQVEQSVSEAEAEIKKEIQNGITDRLDTVISHVDPESKEHPTIKTNTVSPQEIDPQARHVESTMTGGGPPAGAPETPFTVPQDN